MILLQQCDLYVPEAVGRRDVLVAGGRVVAIGERIPVPEGVEVQVIATEGLRMIPGLIDCHVHIAGAGGEGGPATRTPEMQLSQMLDGGVTSVVGCLGTDGMTRSVESVLMKCKGLRQEGVSAWMLTGAYQVPTPTILGDVGKDVAMIDEIIGVGEIAISDHRSSGPTIDELIRLTEHARVGGMLGGKAGVVNFHMGDAQDPFRPLYDMVERSELNLKQFLPTHCNRNDYIFKDAATYGKHGYLDITASSYEYFPEYEIKPSKAIVQLVAAGVPLEHITMTSDGCGSLPDFDEDGNLVKLETGQPKSVLREILAATREEGMPLEQALRVATANVADILKLSGKGRIAVGRDADLVVLDGDDQIQHLVANGTLMIHNGEKLVKGTFER